MLRFLVAEELALVGGEVVAQEVWQVRKGGAVLIKIAVRGVKVRPAGRFTYELKRSTVLATLLSGLLLLFATGGIAWEAVLRFREPAGVNGAIVMIVAAVALVVNALSAWNLMPGSRNDLNLRGAFLHLLSDAGVSAGVILSGGLVLLTGWNWIDPVTSLQQALTDGEVEPRIQ